MSQQSSHLFNNASFTLNGDTSSLMSSAAPRMLNVPMMSIPSHRDGSLHQLQYGVPSTSSFILSKQQQQQQQQHYNGSGTDKSHTNHASQALDSFVCFIDENTSDTHNSPPPPAAVMGEMGTVVPSTMTMDDKTMGYSSFPSPITTTMSSMGPCGDISGGDAPESARNQVGSTRLTLPSPSHHSKVDHTSPDTSPGPSPSLVLNHSKQSPTYPPPRPSTHQQISSPQESVPSPHREIGTATAAAAAAAAAAASISTIPIPLSPMVSVPQSIGMGPAPGKVNVSIDGSNAPSPPSAPQEDRRQLQPPPSLLGSSPVGSHRGLESGRLRTTPAPPTAPTAPTGDSRTTTGGGGVGVSVGVGASINQQQHVPFTTSIGLPLAPSLHMFPNDLSSPTVFNPILYVSNTPSLHGKIASPHQHHHHHHHHNHSANQQHHQHHQQQQQHQSHDQRDLGYTSYSHTLGSNPLGSFNFGGSSALHTGHTHGMSLPLDHKAVPATSTLPSTLSTSITTIGRPSTGKSSTNGGNIMTVDGAPPQRSQRATTTESASSSETTHSLGAHGPRQLTTTQNTSYSSASIAPPLPPLVPTSDGKYNTHSKQNRQPRHQSLHQIDALATSGCATASGSQPTRPDAATHMYSTSITATAMDSNPPQGFADVPMHDQQSIGMLGVPIVSAISNSTAIATAAGATTTTTTVTGLPPPSLSFPQLSGINALLIQQPKPIALKGGLRHAFPHHMAQQHGNAHHSDTSHLFLSPLPGTLSFDATTSLQMGSTKAAAGGVGGGGSGSGTLMFPPQEGLLYNDPSTSTSFLSPFQSSNHTDKVSPGSAMAINAPPYGKRNSHSSHAAAMGGDDDEDLTTENSIPYYDHSSQYLRSSRHKDDIENNKHHQYKPATSQKSRTSPRMSLSNYSMSDTDHHNGGVADGDDHGGSQLNPDGEKGHSARSPHSRGGGRPPSQQNRHKPTTRVGSEGGSNGSTSIASRVRTRRTRQQEESPVSHHIKPFIDDDDYDDGSGTGSDDTSASMMSMFVSPSFSMSPGHAHCSQHKHGTTGSRQSTHRLPAAAAPPHRPSLAPDLRAGTHSGQVGGGPGGGRTHHHMGSNGGLLTCGDNGGLLTCGDNGGGGHGHHHFDSHHDTQAHAHDNDSYSMLPTLQRTSHRAEHHHHDDYSHHNHNQSYHAHAHGAQGYRRDSALLSDKHTDKGEHPRSSRRHQHGSTTTTTTTSSSSPSAATDDYGYQDYMSETSPSASTSTGIYAYDDQASNSHHHNRHHHEQNTTTTTKKTTTSTLIGNSTSVLAPFRRTNQVLCPHCHRQFSSKASLTRHLKIHSNERPHTCELCQRSFAKMTELTRHLRLHNPNRPFSCQYCPKRFTTRANARVHERTHSGVKPYKCDMCPMSFAQISARNNHMRTHTNERPFQCQCGKAFAQAATLKAHLQRRIKPECAPTYR